MSAVRAGLARAKRIAVVTPAHDAAIGAALLGFDAAGLARPEIVPA
jgi:hypothetical protein